ncbi:uncharacterized protein [Montipora capricornis]|uniref:uncharacterized protein n=1 Tax=Montipora capricornis TaxID=246305 RepID=UPI0035F1488B
MPTEHIVPFGLLLLTTIYGCSAQLNISEVGHNFPYRCTVNATVVNNPNFKGVCLSVLMPNETRKFRDLVCLKPGETKNTSGCMLHNDAFLDNCCKENIKEAYFHELEDGSYVFIVIPKDGRMLSCGNLAFIVSSIAGALLSSQDFCTFPSIATAESSSANPHTTIRTSIESMTPVTDATRTRVSGTIDSEDSSRSPTTTSHAVAGTSNKEIVIISLIFFLVKLLCG